MKKTRTSFIITAIFFALFAFFSVNVLWTRIELLCAEIKTIAGGGFEVVHMELKPEGIPALIGIAITVLAAIFVILRIIICKKWTYFISLILIAASLAVFAMVDYFSFRIYFGTLGIGLLKLHQYAITAIFAIPEILQGIGILKRRGLR